MSVEQIAIVGAGAMGRGIAEVAAGAGIATTLVKMTAGPAAEARARIERSLEQKVKKGKLSPERAQATIDKLRFVTVDDIDAIGNAEVVIESIIEDLPTKQGLFALLERHVAPHTVLATNTSSLRVNQVGERLSSPGSQARLLGMHFFSPVPAMKLVEVALTRDTAPFAVERAHDLARAMEKTPVLVGDSAGYIVNRLLVPYLTHAIATLEDGIATAQDIDTAMKLGCGHPMGPLSLSDAIGLDIVYAMARTLYLEHRDPRYSPPPLLRRLVLAGHLGKKTGAGIFDYSTDPPKVNRAVEIIPTGNRTGESA